MVVPEWEGGAVLGNDKVQDMSEIGGELLSSLEVKSSRM